MDSSQLTERQLDALFERLAPIASYPTKLQKCVDSRAFPGDDDLTALVLVSAADLCSRGYRPKAGTPNFELAARRRSKGC